MALPKSRSIALRCGIVIACAPRRRATSKRLVRCGLDGDFLIQSTAARLRAVVCNGPSDLVPEAMVIIDADCRVSEGGVRHSGVGGGSAKAIAAAYLQRCALWSASRSPLVGASCSTAHTMMYKKTIPVAP